MKQKLWILFIFSILISMASCASSEENNNAQTSEDESSQLLLTPGTTLDKYSAGRVYLTWSNFLAGTNPKDIVASDFNGNGTIDLAIADYEGEKLAVLQGIGNGKFGEPDFYKLYGHTAGLAVGDINLDSKSDIIVATNFSGSNLESSAHVFVFLNNGDGTFKGPSVNNVESSPHSVALGDIDNDGKTDLIVGTQTSINMLKGNGDGTFGKPYYCNAGESPMGVIVTNLNNDANLDIAATDFDKDSVSVINGKGSLACNDYSFHSTSNNFVRALTANDFNKDGNIDLAVGNATNNNISILLGKGNGSFDLAGQYQASGKAVSIQSADLDKNGNVDLVAANGAGAVVLLGKGNGTFSAPKSYTFGDETNGLALADFNNDNRVDAAVTSSSDGMVYVGLNKSSPTKAPTSNIVSPANTLTNENFVFCTSCEDCTEKAKTPYAKIKMANNLEYGGPDSCVTISADGVSFDGNGFSFSISDGTAIKAFKTESNLLNITIKNTNIRTIGPSERGISLINCSAALLLSNNIQIESYAATQAIHLSGTSDTKILENNITRVYQSHGAPDGIVILNLSDNNIIDKNFIDIDEYVVNTNTNCIFIDYSSNNIISNNRLSRADNILFLGGGTNNNQTIGNKIEYSVNSGIYLSGGGSPGNIISNNILRYGFYSGIQTAYHYATINHEIKNNLITMNNIGISLFGNSSNFKIIGNRITSNLQGLFITNYPRVVSDFIIYNNLFKNENNIPVPQLENHNLHWNIEKTEGPNIIGGPNIAGNAWSNPNDQGYSDHCTDENFDEICDEQYVIDRYNTDHYPLKIYPPD